MFPCNCCRTCLGVESLNPIFSTCSQSEKYTEILLKTTGIKIELNDSYPHEMCAECISFINQCTKFRITAELAQKALIGRYDNHLCNVKTEPTHIFSTSERKTATIDISAYCSTNESLDTLEVNYDTEVSKMEIIEDNTEPLAEYVSEMPENACIFEVKKRRKRVKGSKTTQPKRSTQKQIAKKKNNIENDLSLENTNDNMANEDEGKKTDTHGVKTRSKEKIECEHCHKILTSRLSLRNHYKIHTGFDVVCEHCGKKFITRRLLLMHCRAKHGYEKTDKCSYCDYTAANAEQVKIHERLHTGEKPYVCQECGAGFHRNSSYLQHVAIHLPEKTVQCEQCPALFKSVTLMRIHASRHKRPSYEYRCRVCAGAFARKRNVVRHLVRIHALSAASAHVERIKIV